jgi:hypothetical protein
MDIEITANVVLGITPYWFGSIMLKIAGAMNE